VETGNNTMVNENIGRNDATRSSHWPAFIWWEWRKPWKLLIMELSYKSSISIIQTSWDRRKFTVHIFFVLLSVFIILVLGN